MTRTPSELQDWALAHPRSALLSITVAEAQQFAEHWPGGTTPHPHLPMRLHERPCIVVDLPPGHIIAPGGTVLPPS